VPRDEANGFIDARRLDREGNVSIL